MDKIKKKNLHHVEIIVKGLVQGVSFRAYTQQKAKSFGLSGYVKNLQNGDVEVVAEGEEEKINGLLLWLRTEGSPSSQVSDVIDKWGKKIEGYNSFRITYE